MKQPTEAELKHIRRHIRDESATYPQTMKPVDPDKWRHMRHTGIIAVWRSRHFMCQVYQKPNEPLRLTIQRSAINDDGGWKDGIAWDDIQRIKAECGYGDQCAIELYPPDRLVVNVANLRHIWIVEPPSFMWGKA